MLITDKTELKQYAACHRVWQGIPGIVRTRGGRTFVSFYSGDTKETYGNFAAVIMSEDGVTYSEPVAVAKKSGKYRCFDSGLWIDPLGRLWFFWNVMPGEGVFASICEDPDAQQLQWGDEFCIGRGVMMNKPLVLSSGEWLFPIAFWRKDIYTGMRSCEFRPDDAAGSFVYKTSDNGKTFVKLGGSDLRDRDFDEHMVVELSNGVLMMLIRAHYGIGVSYSYDRGRNWSSGGDSGLGGPCSRFYIGKLRSGRLLLINHYRFEGRNNLTAMLSEDDGKTFPYTLLLDERSNVSYPDAMESSDGYIDIVYDRERGGFKTSLEEACADAREILTARVTEQDILKGTLVSEGSFLKRVACKLGALAPEDPDPYQEKPVSDSEFAQMLIRSGETDMIQAIFEKYPVNCMNVCKLDAKKLDALICRFRESDNRDEDLLVKIIQFIRQAPQQPVEPYPIIEKIKAYIEQNLTDDFSVAALAEDVQISIYYLSHLFKSVTGTTVIEYRNELRLTKAKLMLIHTEDSINDIAQNTGFCSAAYFAEVFSKSEKVPPSEYRKYHGVVAVK